MRAVDAAQSLLSLFYTLNGTNSDALGAVILIFTLIAGVRIDHKNVTFFNGSSRTFRGAKPASGAFVGDFHRHFIISSKAVDFSSIDREYTILENYNKRFLTPFYKTVTLKEMGVSGLLSKIFIKKPACRNRQAGVENDLLLANRNYFRRGGPQIDNHLSQSHGAGPL